MWDLYDDCDADTCLYGLLQEVTKTQSIITLTKQL